MMSPKREKQVRVFVVLVNYYSYVRPIRSHLLRPLTALTSYKLTFKWKDVEHKSCEDIKCIAARDTLLAYTYLNVCFDVLAETIHFHIGLMIIQKGKPIMF